jgi:hypothetical protein
MRIRPGPLRRSAVWLRRATLAATVAALGTPAAGATGQSAVRSVHLLTAGERASVVIEFDTTVSRATPIESVDARTFLVDIGPVPSAVVAESRQTGPSTPLIRQVHIQGLPEASSVRVHVMLREPAAGSVRVSERRVYLDFAPGATGSRMLVPREPDSEDALLQRAGALARVPDVRGVLSVKEELLRRRGLTEGSKRASAAAATDPALVRVEAHLAAARRQQLVEDARLFRQAELDLFRAALRQAASDLDTLNAALQAPTAAALTRARTDAARLASRLRALKAPAAVTAAHTRLCATVDAVVVSLSQPSADHAASAAALAIGRARGALTAALAGLPERAS